MELKKKLAAALLAVGMATATPKTADASAAVEGTVGHKKTTIDATVDEALTKDKKFRLFLRGIADIPYEGKPGFVGIVMPYFDLGKGFGAGGELVIDGAGAMPKAAVQYFGEYKGFSAFVLVDAGYLKDLDVELLTTFSYRPKIGKDLKLFTKAELLHAFGKDGLKYGSDKFRLGLEKDGTIFGVAGDIGYSGPKPKDVDYNIGVFVRKEFD